MGARPSFPTDQQWTDWRNKNQEQKEEIKETLETQLEENEKLQEKISKEFGEKAVNYMRECQDKSQLSRLFWNQKECTKAKEELMSKGMEYLSSIGAGQNVESALNKLEKLV